MGSATLLFFVIGPKLLISEAINIFGVYRLANTKPKNG